MTTSDRERKLLAQISACDADEVLSAAAWIAHYHHHDGWFCSCGAACPTVRVYRAHIGTVLDDFAVDQVPDPAFTLDGRVEVDEFLDVMDDAAAELTLAAGTTPPTYIFRQDPYGEHVYELALDPPITVADGDTVTFRFNPAKIRDAAAPTPEQVERMRSRITDTSENQEGPS